MTDRARLRKRNLAAFRRAHPALHDRLRAFRPESELVFGADGTPDVIVDGKPRYGGRIDAFVADQVKRFWEAGPNRFITEAPAADKQDEHTNRMLDRFMSRARAAGAEFAFGPTRRRSYFLVVMGVGLGRHIDALVAETDCQVVVFVDHSLEFLHHSLPVYDWQVLFEAMAAKGGRVLFLVDDRPARLSEAIRGALRNANPCSVDGFTCFIHDPSPALAQALGHFTANLNLILFGMGFFYDESLMVRNTYGNLRSGTAKVYRRLGDERLDVPVFVVATGPSLDTSMEFLKENRENAIIVSAGTALRSLMVNGIVPDFQVEIENIYVYPLVKQVADEFDLSAVTLVAASTLEPHTVPLFENVVYFFRAGLSPYPLFSGDEDTTLRFPDPTVANTALSFALEAGFRDIYLFGVDLGGPEGGLHHSADSYHYTEGAIVVEKDLVFVIPVEGNFGGRFVTSNDLYIARDVISGMLRFAGKDQRVFNCSDGALIEGATPRRAETLKLRPIAGGKRGTVERIVGAFPVYDRARFDAAWDENRIVAAIDRFADSIVAWIDGAGDLEDKGYLTRLMGLIPPKVERDRRALDPADEMAILMFRGTLIMMVSALEYHLNRVADPAKSEAVQAIVREELARAMEGLRWTAIGHIRNPSEVPDPGATGDDGAKNLIPEMPQTWGTVGRNQPCPCGSGRKYKHCHGRLA